jgi:uncharacterized protein
MTKEYSPDRLDVKAFVQASAHLAGHESLLTYERLAQEAKGLHPALRVDWQAQGELRPAAGGVGTPQLWLHLTVHATFPMQCQRCLTPVDVPLDVDRWFRFVADEATAEALDEEAEDELLMALPVVPRHEVCPTHVPMEASDEDFDAASAERPNPFAALASLRIDKDKK